MTVQKRAQFVHVVSHGPHCLDGVTAAVVLTRYHRDATVVPHFCSNAEINETLLGLHCDPPAAEHVVWITDISWTDPAVDGHLQRLLDRGVRVYWIDHHRTAIRRYRNGEISVRLTDQVLSEQYAAARLTYEYLCERLTAEAQSSAALADLGTLVAMADDHDRWLHRIPGSWKLGQVVAALGAGAYRELLQLNAAVASTPRMQEVERALDAELRRSADIAERSRCVQPVAGSDLRLVTAVCDGFPNEIADAWGKTFPNSIFALFDGRSLSVSLRRSPDCAVDLSEVAGRIGGGGHPAAAGCDLPELRRQIAKTLAATVARALAERSDTDPRRAT